VSSLAAYTALVGLVAAERLAELLVARSNAAFSFSRGGVELGREHYPIMVAAHAAFLVSCLLEPWVFGGVMLPWVGLPALFAVFAAQGLRWWAIVSLGRRWNTRVIVVPGAPRVVSGPYRWLRHPNYVAVVIEGLALPLVHGAWMTAVWFSLVNGLILATRIRCEDRALAWATGTSPEGAMESVEPTREVDS
jgi:methyltransferase